MPIVTAALPVVVVPKESKPAAALYALFATAPNVVLVRRYCTSVPVPPGGAPEGEVVAIRFPLASAAMNVPAAVPRVVFITPVLEIENTVVVAVAVDEAIANNGCPAVSFVELFIDNFAHGVVVPMPTLPPERIRTLSILLVPNTSGIAGCVPITKPLAVPNELLNTPTSPQPPRVKP